MIIVTSAGDVIDVEPPTPQQAFRASYLVTLTGGDGTTWDLNNGPVTLMAGVKLFDMPPLTAWTKTAPAVPGARWQGFHVDEQTYTLPVRVQGDDWEAYRLVEKAFFNSLDPNSPVVVTVTAPDGVSRSISCQFLSPGDLTDDTDPLVFARRSYQLVLLAPDPFWYGPLVAPEPFDLADPVAFLVPPGPPVYINPPTASASSTIANPGDVPAWPRFTIVGQWSSFSVGVGSAVVSSTKGYAVGRSITIDSSPRQRSIVDESGARVWADMNQIGFGNMAVPPGAEVPITLSVTGFSADTTLEVELTPLYWRPL